MFCIEEIVARGATVVMVSHKLTEILNATLLTAEGANQSVTGTCTDLAGNSASRTRSLVSSV